MRFFQLGLASLVLLVLSFFSLPTLANNTCDCTQHAASASGPGACSKSEDSSKCTITYKNSTSTDEWNQHILSGLSKVDHFTGPTQFSDYQSVFKAVHNELNERFRYERGALDYANAAMNLVGGTGPETFGHNVPNVTGRRERDFAGFILPTALSYSNPSKYEDIYLKLFYIFHHNIDSLEDSMEYYFYPLGGVFSGRVYDNRNGKKYTFDVSYGCFRIIIDNVVMSIKTPYAFSCG